MASDESYKLVFEEIVEPVTKEFNPQIIISNGGSDPHFADKLTNLGLSLKGFEMIGKMLNKMAKICQGKVVDLIGSGYNQKVLPLAWLSLISGLTAIEVSLEEPFSIPEQLEKDSTLPETQKIIKEVKKKLKNYWKFL